MKLSGKECKERKLGEEWDEKHDGHFISRYTHIAYKNSEEVKYDCHLCLLCEEVARIEIGRKKISGQQKRGRSRNSSNSKSKGRGSKAVYKPRYQGGDGFDNQMHGDIHGELGGGGW